MIELIKEEIRQLFPLTNRGSVYTDTYIVNCSRTFMDRFVGEFIKQGFVILSQVISVGEDVIPPKWVSFQIPNIGYLKFIPDLEQGYKIQKVDGSNNA